MILVGRGKQNIRCLISKYDLKGGKCMTKSCLRQFDKRPTRSDNKFELYKINYRHKGNMLWVGRKLRKQLFPPSSLHMSASVLGFSLQTFSLTPDIPCRLPCYHAKAHTKLPRGFFPRAAARRHQQLPIKEVVTVHPDHDDRILLLLNNNDDKATVPWARL